MFKSRRELRGSEAQSEQKADGRIRKAGPGLTVEARSRSATTSGPARGSGSTSSERLLDKQEDGGSSPSRSISWTGSSTSRATARKRQGPRVSLTWKEREMWCAVPTPSVWRRSRRRHKASAWALGKEPYQKITRGRSPIGKGGVPERIASRAGVTFPQRQTRRDPGSCWRRPQQDAGSSPAVPFGHQTKWKQVKAPLGRVCLTEVSIKVL